MWLEQGLGRGYDGEDEDVAAERARVAGPSGVTDAISLRNLRLVYHGHRPKVRVVRGRIKTLPAIPHSTICPTKSCIFAEARSIETSTPANVGRRGQFPGLFWTRCVSSDTLRE